MAFRKVRSRTPCAIFLQLKRSRPCSNNGGRKVKCKGSNFRLMAVDPLRFGAPRSRSLKLKVSPSRCKAHNWSRKLYSSVCYDCSHMEHSQGHRRINGGRTNLWPSDAAFMPQRSHPAIAPWPRRGTDEVYFGRSDGVACRRCCKWRRGLRENVVLIRAT